MSADVQRYDLNHDLMVMWPLIDGDWVRFTDHEAAVQAARDEAVADNDARWVLSITEEFSPEMTVAEMVEFLGDPAYSVPSLAIHDAKVWNAALEAAYKAVAAMPPVLIAYAVRPPQVPNIENPEHYPHGLPQVSAMGAIAALRKPVQP